MALDKKTKQFVINGLRRLTFRYPPKYQCKNNARVVVSGEKHFRYRCNICKQLFRSGEVEIDHIHPVSPNGWEGFDKFVERLFCSVENLQTVCETCHDIKSASEGVVRRKRRKKKLKKETQ